MSKVNIYLSGACKHVNDDFQNWRNDITRYIGLHYYEDYLNVIDPISHFDYKHNLPNTDKECHDLFYYLIDQSNILVVNLDNSTLSPGTVAEVHHAYMKHIPVIGFGSDTSGWYAWAKEECSAVLNNYSDAIDYIVAHYCIS